MAMQVESFARVLGAATGVETRLQPCGLSTAKVLACDQSIVIMQSSVPFQNCNTWD
jgi:hypothetical protein